MTDPDPTAAELQAATERLRIVRQTCNCYDAYKDGSTEPICSAYLADLLTIRDAYLAAPRGAVAEHAGGALWSALNEYRKAQRRMLERWADGDDAVKKELWRALHACEQPATDALEATPPADNAGRELLNAMIEAWQTLETKDELWARELYRRLSGVLLNHTARLAMSPTPPATGDDAERLIALAKSFDPYDWPARDKIIHAELVKLAPAVARQLIEARADHEHLRQDNQALAEALIDLLHNKREHHCSGCQIEKARAVLVFHARDFKMVTAEQRRRQDALERYREEYEAKTEPQKGG